MKRRYAYTSKSRRYDKPKTHPWQRAAPYATLFATLSGSGAATWMMIAVCFSSH